MTWKIVVPDIPPSLNKSLRAHWAARGREKKRWLAMLFYLAAAAKIPRAVGKRIVIIERQAHGILDEDNLVASAKEVIVDNLKPAKVWRLKNGKVRQREGLGLIVEDSPAWVQVIYRQCRVPKAEAQRTVIEVRDATDGGEGETTGASREG